MTDFPTIKYQKNLQKPLLLKVFINGSQELKDTYQKYIDKHNYNLLLNTHPDSGVDLFSSKENIIDKNTYSNLIDLNISAALFEEVQINPTGYTTIIISSLSTLVLLLFLNASFYMYLLLSGMVGTMMFLYDTDDYYGYIKEQPLPYLLCCRSSTGSKTPLRLSNHIGIIDSGYRGNLLACVDCLGDKNYTIEKYSRLFQIVAFSGRPIYVKLVKNHDELSTTSRGKDGFGSTGK